MGDFYAKIDFPCQDTDCEEIIDFNLMELKKKDGLVNCPCCHSQYDLSDEGFISKLEKLRNLLLSVREAEDILGDCNVGVMTLAGEKKVPYKLLLTRLNTMITLELNDKKVDFTFRVEPLKDSQFI